MKDKPNKWGIKLYELCESSSDYVSDFEIYAADPNQSNKPVDVCVRLMQPYLDRGYWLYTDNYYTCPALAYQLMERGTVKGAIDQWNLSHRSIGHAIDRARAQIVQPIVKCMGKNSYNP